MEVLVNYAILILIVVEYFSFLYVVLRRERKEFSKKHVIWTAILLICLILISFGEWRLTPLYGIGLLFSIGTTFILFKNSFADILKLYLVAYPALAILESIVIYIIEVTVDMGQKENAIVCLLCITAALWLYYALLGRKLDKDAFQMSDHVWLIVSGVSFLIWGLISYFTFILTKIINVRGKTIGMIVITAGGLAVFVLNYVMIYYFNTKQKYQTQSDLLEQYNEQQKQYFEDLLRKERDTRQFRHDITAHLLQIQNFCENGQHEEEAQYIRELLDEITLINKKGYRVGNDIIDTILNTYLAPLASTCTVKVKGCVDHEIGIARKDLCVIVSNLVQNAVEAVEQSTAEHKEIFFEINQGRQFLGIQVKNTADTEKIRIRNRYPVTRKGNQRMHGMGIRNVRAAAEAYHGSYQYRIEQDYYIAEVRVQI